MVTWKDGSIVYEGIIKKNPLKDKVTVTCVKKGGRGHVKLMVISRKRLIPKKMSKKPVNHRLLERKYKRKNSKELVKFLTESSLTSEQRHVITQILTERKYNFNSSENINKTQRKDVLYVDPKLLVIEVGFNTRVDYGDIEELKNSIVENGVRVPLRGYKNPDGTYTVVDGHRRHTATMLAIKEGVDIARLPFISEKKRTEEERVFDIILSNDGKPLTPLELGETYKRLVNYGYGVSEIAKKIGKSISHVSDMITVANSSKSIKGLVQENVISASLVAKLKNKVKDTDKAEKIIKKKAKKKNKVVPKDFPDILEKSYSKAEVLQLLKKQIAACSRDICKNCLDKVLNIQITVK